nr:DUF2339 domain-containing protein [uncultured Sphingosinicella sp.]
MALTVILFLGTLALLLAVALYLGARVAKLEEDVATLRTALQTGRAQVQPVAGDVSSPSAATDGTLAALFERFVGGRLLIWVGGVALAAAGIFLIRHSIELVTPEARMIAAALLGLVLIGVGEYARKGWLLSGDARIGQALVGAGIAVLYATAYGSHLLFGLIGSGTAALLMVLITAAALGLAFRHGTATAALGLVGGFATPLLVGERDAGALPVLAYLALLDVAIFAIAWRRGWTWLVAAAVAASFAWTGYFVLDAAEDALAAGLFAAILGIVASLPRSRQRLTLAPPAIVALGELAVLVGRPEIGAAAWLLFGAVAVGSLAIALFRPEQRLLPLGALAIALLLLAFQAAIGEDPFAPTAAVVVTLLFAGACAPAVRRGDGLAVVTASAALAGPLLIFRLLRPELMPTSLYGALALSLGAAALATLWLVRSGTRDRTGIGGLVASGTAALLLAIGAYDVAPRDLVSGLWLLLAVALLLAGIRVDDKALRVAGLALLTATVFKVFLIDAAALEGVLRILSFLGLGIALIGIGLLYGKVLGREAKPAQA